MDKPTASAETLMEQASETAHFYLARAIEDIDKQLGNGFAEEHSELIVAHMNAAALDYHAASITAGLWEIAQSIDKIEK